MTVKKFLLLILTITAATLAAGFGLPGQQTETLFRASAYFFVLVTFVLWLAYALAIIFRHDLPACCKRHFPAFILAVVLMAGIYHMAPPYFKILSDETNLIGVSMAMHENKTATLPIKGYALDYAGYDFQDEIGQRPLLFPFITSLVHGISGYRPQNGFAVNFLCGLGILFLVYFYLNRFFSRQMAFAGMIILASYPHYVFWVTSSGFETLNLFFLLVVFGALFYFLQNPTATAAEFLFLSLILLASIRYESGLLLLGLLLLFPRIVNKTIVAAYHPSLYLFPVLMLPLLWQRHLKSFSGHLQPDAVAAVVKPGNVFGLENFFANFPPNMFVLSGFDARFGFLPLVSLLALLGLYMMSRKILLRPASISANKRITIFFCLTGYLLLFILYTAFHWGDFRTDIDNRLAMIFLPAIVFPAIFALHQIEKKMPDKNKLFAKIVIICAFIQLAYYWPVGARQQLLQGKSLTYTYKRVTDYIASNYDLKQEKILIVTDRPNLYIIYGMGAVDFGDARSQTEKIRYFRRIYYDHILVLQKCRPQTDQIIPHYRLTNNYRLQEVEQIPVGPGYSLKISQTHM